MKSQEPKDEMCCSFLTASGPSLTCFISFYFGPPLSYLFVFYLPTHTQPSSPLSSCFTSLPLPLISERLVHAFVSQRKGFLFVLGNTTTSKPSAAYGAQAWKERREAGREGGRR